MKLLFKKNKNQSELFIVKEGAHEIFNYIQMIKYIIAGDILENAEFEGDYSEEEMLKVNEMVDKIRETLSKGDEHIEKIDDLPDELFSSNVEVESIDDEIMIENIPF